MKEDHSKLLKEGDTFNERIKEINSKLQVETKKLNRSMKLVDSKKTEIDSEYNYKVFNHSLTLTLDSLKL